jgi:hypothetical protein
MAEKINTVDFNIPGKWEWEHGEQLRQKPGEESGKDYLTRASTFPGEDLKRPVANRWNRAYFVNKIHSIREAYKQYKKDGLGYMTKEEYEQETKSLVSDIKVMDELFPKFLNGEEKVSVDMGELGVQEAEYVYLTSSRTDFSKRVNVVVPGYSNDRYGGGMLPLTLALYSNAPVLLLTYFEVPRGKMTNETKKAVKKSKDFGPHVEFTEGAINQILGKNSKFDFTGVSAGGVIVAQISKKREMAGRIGNINIVNPPGLAKLERIIPRLWIHHKSMAEIKRNGMAARLLVANEKKVTTTKEDLKRFESMKRHWVYCLAHEFNWWEKMGKARVIIAKDDGITDGFENIYKLESNPNLSVRVVEGGHEVPGTEPEKVIEQMLL